MARAELEQVNFALGAGSGRQERIWQAWHRRVLVGVLLATILAGFGMIMLSQSRPEPETIPAAITSRLVENRSMAELGSLPGFQRRGNSVIGEVCTRDGQVLRLVLDARNQSLLGFRLLETRTGDRPACPPPAPLPAAATPAN